MRKILVQKKKLVGCNITWQANKNQSHETAAIVNEIIGTKNSNHNTERKKKRETNC